MSQEEETSSVAPFVFVLVTSRSERRAWRTGVYDLLYRIYTALAYTPSAGVSIGLH